MLSINYTTMRFNNRGSFRTSMTYLLKKKEFQKILVTNLGLNSTDVEDFLMSKNILKFPRHRLINNCLICQKHNVNVRPLANFGHFLIFHSYKLEHRINLLKDIGVPDLNSFLISKMIQFFHKHVSTFKEQTNVPGEQNIGKNIFDRLGHEVPIDISRMESSRNKLTVDQYYKTCLLYCKIRIFDLPYLDDNIMLHQYMKFKSISMIAETLRVLRINLDYNEKMIKENPFVITASADNIKSLLDSFTDICGIPIVTLLRNYPRILFQDADNIKRLLMSIKRYEIPEKYITKCMMILEMGNDIFIERMEMIKRQPNLNIWCKHPRILQLIVHKDMTKDRLNYLHAINCSKWIRPQTVLGRPSNMNKFLQSIVLNKKGLKHIFMRELGIDKTDLLTRHPHWKMVGFTDVEQMLNYLLNHFTINEICQNIHITLYKKSKVEKVLADLKQRYSQSTEYSFTNGQYLALCLYMLEKDSHFTGDGIWNNEHDAKRESLLPLEKRNIAENTGTVQNINEYLNSEDGLDISDDFNAKDSNDMNNRYHLDNEDETFSTKRQNT